MRLIDDQHAPRQPQQPQWRVPGRQYRHDRLVDCPDADFGEERFAAIVRNPLAALRFRRLILRFAGVDRSVRRPVEDAARETLMQGSATVRQNQ